MNRRIFLPLILILAIFFHILPIFAVDFGALLSSNTQFDFQGDGFGDLSLEQSETLLPFLKIPAGKAGYFAIEAEVTHKFTRDFELDQNENNLILDATLLKFSKTFSLKNASFFEMSLGRMIASDSTGIVFAQAGDGAYLKFASPVIEVAAYGAYSGLQNMKNVKMLSTSGFEILSTEDKKIYEFAAPFVIADLSVTAPYLFARQTLGFEAGAILPTEGPSTLPDGEKNRLFATLSMNGPFTPHLFYKLQASAQTSDFSDLALLMRAALSWYATFKNAALNISGVYASGENGALSTFRPLTKNAACLSRIEPNYSGVLKGGLSASILPVKQLFISAGLDAVFDASDDVEFFGMQANLGAKWQAASDLQVTLDGAGFFAKEKVMNRIQVTLGIALAF